MEIDKPMYDLLIDLNHDYNQDLLVHGLIEISSYLGCLEAIIPYRGR